MENAASGHYSGRHLVSSIRLVKARNLIPVILVLAALLAYCDSFTGPFIYDDVASIVDNPTIRHLWSIGNVLSPPRGRGLTVEGRPMVNLSLAINYALGGTNVVGYHVFNLVIHILVGLTLYGVMRRTLLNCRARSRLPEAGLQLLRKRHRGVSCWQSSTRLRADADDATRRAIPPEAGPAHPPMRDATGPAVLAFAVALLWLVHPLLTESVTYVIQRAELIMSLFYLLTLYCFIRGAESSSHSRAWHGLCLAACGLGMASKEVMITAPVMVLLYDRTFLSGSFSEAWRRRWRLYLALAGTWIVLGYLVWAGSVGVAMANAESLGITGREYLMTEPRVLLHYLKLSVWPHPLCFNYDGWPIVRSLTGLGWPAVVIALILAGIAWALWRNSAWGFLGAWFFLILAPTSSFMPLDSPAYEHRVYLSLAAIVVAVTLVLYTLAGRRATVAISVVLAVGLGFLSWRRNQDYRTELAIWADTVAKRPDNPRAQNNLGRALLSTGRFSEAIQHLEQAIKLRPKYAVAVDNLGNALAQSGHMREAVEQFALALQLRPDLTEAQFNMARAQARLGNLPKAVEYYENTIRLNPEDAEAHAELGNALLSLGKIQDAVQHWVQAVNIKPDYAEPRNNLAVALAHTGRFADAAEQFRQVVAITPNDPEAHYNYANALTACGRAQQAIGEYETALQLRPSYPDAENNLARLLASVPPANGGSPTEAVQLAEAACNATSNQVAPYLETLGEAYASVGRFDDAIRTADKTLAIARATGQTQLVQQVQMLMEMYRGERRYRELKALRENQTPPNNP